MSIWFRKSASDNCSIVARLFIVFSSGALLVFADCQPLFAQSAPVFPTGPLPTDITPIRLPEEREIFTPGPTFYLFNKLPPRLWFNFTMEANQRVETNVYLKQFTKATDYVFRAFPNLTLGYSLGKGASIYCNYFVIKDVYAQNPQLTGPTTQSLSLGFRQQIPIGEKSSLQFDFQSRELWQSAGLHQADLIPGLLFNRILTKRLIGYTNIQLQMRGADYFVAPTREIDPFYTVGLLYSYNKWLFTAVDTFICNYRHPPFNFAVPLHGNEAMIADFEVAHPISNKLPNLVAFVRAEPIWNWNSGGTPGISGFDFRLYSGFRMSLNKAAHNTTVDKLRKQLLEMQTVPNPSTGSPPTTLPAPSSSVPDTASPKNAKSKATTVSSPNDAASEATPVDGLRLTPLSSDALQSINSSPPEDLIAIPLSLSSLPPLKTVPLSADSSLPPNSVPAEFWTDIDSSEAK